MIGIILHINYLVDDIMNKINPIKSILYNFFSVVEYYKSINSLIYATIHIMTMIDCYFTHKKEDLELSCLNNKLYRCRECGILWSGK